MSDLINLFIYYDRMREYYEFMPLMTEDEIARYHQFKILARTVAREIEAML